MTRIKLRLVLFHAFVCGFCVGCTMVAATLGWTWVTAVAAATLVLNAVAVVVHLRDVEQTGPAQNGRTD